MSKLTPIAVGIAAILLSCSQPTQDTKGTEQKASAKPTYYGRNLDNMVRLVTYDVYGQKIADGLGVYIGADIVLTSFNFIKGAFNVKMNKMDSKQVVNVFGYVTYDIDNDLVALRVGKRQPKLCPIDTAQFAKQDTLYTLDSKKGKTFRTLYTNDGTYQPGTAFFSASGNLTAITGNDGQTITAPVISAMASHLPDGHQNIYDLRLKTNKVYPSYTTIRGFRIVTSMGNINIRLYNETPEYRDNFIKLVCDHFYDSLLVHRVLPGYLIQTGAADSKHAKRDDIVGWQGPGYKLPMQLVPGLFHRRGVIAASKLPSDVNTSNRSDGSQFYIVAGHKFTASDLDEIERDYGKHFSAHQRQVYQTVGGAPYLDGDYTIFGEVTSGMDIVDQISNVPVKGDRPVTDIRVWRIELIR